jgi:hypothetical protein
MNDIVSIRKIRPLPSAEVSAAGAAFTCGNFFLAGNELSLAADEFFSLFDAGSSGKSLQHCAGGV